ncbi:pyridoxal phosphate-dependent aminotransferase [Methylomonas koyamae]|uniref:pyridoxal phosphate-dependent aminotransferase n=1 Tax=Methylomonas koyamae TaxID=702114 RepID=UPI00278C2235|nr:aminotransferase class I/II-fold pyridoxal phosphate-dependent enzyme [Methylomonas koyamae]
MQRELGLSEVIKLASNENPLGTGRKVAEAIQNTLPEIARYPDGSGYALKTTISARWGVDLAQITLGNGSSEILELVMRTFVAPEHEVVFAQHAFALYPILTQAVGAKAVVVPAKNYGHDLDAMRAAVTAKTRVVFIANPNNPTGTLLAPQAWKISSPRCRNRCCACWTKPITNSSIRRCAPNPCSGRANIPT